MKGNGFTKNEMTRYSRHFVLPAFGETGQRKLKNARVTIIGAGGLGAPVLQYLAAAGLGTIRVIDFDTVNESNLQRQVLFNTGDIGNEKSAVAAQRLSALNPHINVEHRNVRITAENAMDLLSGSDVIADCSDNFPTRYLVNDAAVLLDIPLVYGSIFRYEGQVAVFRGRTGPNYRDLFPQPPNPDAVPDCETGGVLGALPGVIGSMQSIEVIKLVTGIGASLSGKLLVLDALTMETQIFNIPNQNQGVKIKALIDYDDFCGINRKKKENWSMKEITVQELKELIDNKTDFQLIDVREPHEYDLCNLDGELIPMAEVPNHTDRISKDKQVVLHCRSGKRSGDMIIWLEKTYGFTNLYNLKGGILAWAREIDPSMPTY